MGKENLGLGSNAKHVFGVFSFQLPRGWAVWEFCGGKFIGGEAVGVTSMMLTVCVSTVPSTFLSPSPSMERFLCRTA